MFVCALLLEPICFSIILDPFALCDMLIPAGWKPGRPGLNIKKNWSTLLQNLQLWAWVSGSQKEAQSLSVCLPQALWRVLGFVSQRGRVALVSQGIARFVMVTDIMGTGSYCKRVREGKCRRYIRSRERKSPSVLAHFVWLYVHITEQANDKEQNCISRQSNS